jgi:hypothetical protein
MENLDPARIQLKKPLSLLFFNPISTPNKNTANVFSTT